MEIEEGKSALLRATNLLQKEDLIIEKIFDERVPATPLLKEVKTLVGIISSHIARLKTLCGSVPPCNGWSLSVREFKGEKNILTVDCLFAAKGREQIRLSWASLPEPIKPSQVLSVVLALSTLPAILMAWQKDVEKGKKEAAAKLEKTESELVEAEKQLADLCREVIAVSQHILNSKEK